MATVLENKIRIFKNRKLEVDRGILSSLNEKDENTASTTESLRVAYIIIFV